MNRPPFHSAAPPPAATHSRDGAFVMTNNELVDAHHGLVRSIAWKIHQKVSRRVPLEDLISEGSVGLLEAAHTFDRSRGFQFSTFAYYRIRGAILDSLSRQSWFNRADYHGSRYERLSADMLAADAEQATAGEHPVEWIDRAAGRLAVSYAIAQEGERQLANTLEADDAGPAESALSGEMRDRLAGAIDRLSPDAATLIRATYFEGLSLTAAGERIGISKSWASRLHHQALGQLAGLLDPDAARDDDVGKLSK